MGKSQPKVIGIYGEWYTHPEMDAPQVRLNAEGKQLLAEWMVKYPSPVALLVKCYPAMYSKALKLGMDGDHLNSLCMEGVVRSFIRYQPGRNAVLDTVVAWGVRAAVSRELAVWDKRAVEFTSSGRWDRTADERSQEPEFDGDGVDRHTDSFDQASTMLSNARLTPREQQALTAKFEGSKGLETIGKDLGVSKERARQLVESALSRIRAANGVRTVEDEETDRRRERVRVACLAALRRQPTSRARLVYLSRATNTDIAAVMDSLVRDGEVERVRNRMNKNSYRLVRKAVMV